MLPGLVCFIPAVVVRHVSKTAKQRRLPATAFSGNIKKEPGTVHLGDCAGLFIKLSFAALRAQQPAKHFLSVKFPLLPAPDCGAHPAHAPDAFFP